MKLSIQTDDCNSCEKKVCLSNCPKNLPFESAFNCRHCDKESAACAASCKQSAFYEISKGILAIDNEVCNGCGECLQACPEKAIALEFGKAKKCDLCAESNFSLACIKACGKISFESSCPEGLAGRIIGWKIARQNRGDFNKQLKASEDFEIVETRETERVYNILGIPELSFQEAKLFRAVLVSFQAGKSKKKTLEGILESYCLHHLLLLDAEQKKYLLELLELSAFGYGPVSILLKNNDLEEIAIIGIRKPVFVFDRNFGWLRTNLSFHSERAVRNLVNKMAEKLGRRLTMQTPKLNAVLEDGSRLAASIAPVAFSGPSVTIRKFRETPFSPPDLVANNTISADAMAFLWMAMETDCSFLIAGNTGSGKTSTLNALFCMVGGNERIVTIEETPEIRLQHNHWVRLNVVENLGISMKNLIIDSLRMRPDRIIVGEIRNREETLAFIDTLLAGQGKGSYATFHAQSASEAVLRLKTIGVNEIDISSIGLVIVQRRWTRISSCSLTEQRRIVEICELIAEEGKTRINTLFSYNYKKERLERRNESEKLFETISRSFGLGRKGIEAELRKRKTELERQAFLKNGSAFSG